MNNLEDIKDIKELKKFNVFHKSNKISFLNTNPNALDEFKRCFLNTKILNNSPRMKIEIHSSYIFKNGKWCIDNNQDAFVDDHIYRFEYNDDVIDKSHIKIDADIVDINKFCFEIDLLINLMMKLCS